MDSTTLQPPIDRTRPLTYWFIEVDILSVDKVPAFFVLGPFERKDDAESIRWDLARTMREYSVILFVRKDSDEQTLINNRMVLRVKTNIKSTPELPGGVLHEMRAT